MAHALTRRRLLVTSPAALALPAVLGAGGALAASPAPSLIMHLFAEWQAWMDLANQEPWSDEIYEARVPERERIEAAMLAAPITSAQDLAALVVALSGEGCFCLPDSFTLMCARLAGRPDEKLPRCLFKDEA